ncbi:Cytochrome c biogenesis protein Ccs1 [Streptomyces sp. RB5]|uniref:Cytochrome c biogenesis protein Ccs1 n=1 Tax=Streptomyces smaragdinus TaxID=2585196 RepID=A0A7K0CIY0_9ACTN|nr:cytochrome c biogenesis protein ResB [Streptomyces smaragdinus]MQY13440.1 Cytochrome c biogenesis protein Ccs1 [Streptomyces smaragdinus]
MTATDERELSDAAAQLSTAPLEDGGQQPAPGLGAGREIVAWARWFWRQLTSMRVALILLFLLSLGAVPGSLIPQNSVDESKVQLFKDEHGALAGVYDKLQLFDVYSSVWFSAIYLLLFISLAGCIIPRTWQFVGQLRARAPKAPSRLNRLPAYTTWRTDAEPEAVLEASRTVLRRRRFRAHVAGDAVAAEKGYLREAGNLLFHVALFVLLIAFAAGRLFHSEAGKLIVEGDGFSNTFTQYDYYKESAFGTGDPSAFGFTLDKFTASYQRTGPQKRTPRVFRADITYWKGADGPKHKTSIEVNKPLVIDGTKVWLLSNGWAPVVTVRDGQGDIAFRGPVPMIPAEKRNLSSQGAIKVTDYVGKDGKKDQIGFQGFFMPTYLKGSGQMMSQFPEPLSPGLFLTAYKGDLGLDTGVPQNVYQLDVARMKQFKDKNGDPFRQVLAIGDKLTLPDGAGTLTFDGVKPWATFKIGKQYGNEWVLIGALTAIAGLAGSLFIQRRRVWVRARRDEDGTTVVELAGLGRSESAKLPEELADLAVRLQTAAPARPEPSVTTSDEGARA